MEYSAVKYSCPLKALKDYNLRIAGNYMIGYPDETREEIMTYN